MVNFVPMSEHEIVMPYGLVQVKVHTVLISDLDGIDIPARVPAALTPGKPADTYAM